MIVAIEVWSSDFEQVASTCSVGERLGLGAFYYGESPTGLNVECWSALSALAQVTERIRLGPIIANVLADYRSLALLGRQAATVAVISEGRLDFRTGAGADRRFGRAWWEPFGVPYGSYEDRLGALARALNTLGPFWRGEPVDFGSGDAVRLGFECPPIPVTVAASGERAMSLAASVAEVWETSFCSPEELGRRRRSLPVPPSRLPPSCSLEIDGFVGTTRARAAAVIDSARRDRSGSGEDLDAVFARALVGTPAEVALRLGELAAAGADQVVVALHDPHDRDALEALAEAAHGASLDPGPDR